MPIQSIHFLTYYNIFEYAYPVCLLTIFATFLYLGIGLLRTGAPFVMSSRLVLVLWAIFFLPTFLHCLSHLTDNIVNTTLNNALNWFGLVAIPSVLFLGWRYLPSFLVFGKSADEVRQHLMEDLKAKAISFQDSGKRRLATAYGTLVILPLAFRSIVVIASLGRGAQVAIEPQTQLKQRYSSESPNKSSSATRKAAVFTILLSGTALTLCIISWGTSVLLITPRPIIKSFQQLIF